MYQIQLLNSDGTVSSIYDQSRMNERSVSAPACTQNVNEAGTLEFTLTKNHPLINTLEPISSFVNVLDDGEEIFYGRVLKRSDPTLTGMVTFQCEGAMTFLLDSEVPPDGKDSSGNQNTRTLSAQAFFEWCIARHNADVNDPRREFTVGIVNADRRNETKEYSISSYTQTKTAIENYLLDEYGGFIRIRPKDGGGHYIDWIQNYDTLNPQPIQIGSNVAEQTNEIDGSNLFTGLRPVGKDGITLDTPILDLYPDDKMRKMGRIVKTIEFRDAETQEELTAKANAYKQRIEKTLYINSSIRLVDMHYLDGTYPKIRLGDRFNNIYGLEGTEVVVSSLELHFEAPQNDTLTLNNRKSLDPDTMSDGSGSRNQHKGNSSYTKNNSKRSGQYFKYLKEYDDTLEVLAPQVYMHGETLRQYYERIEQQASYYEALSSRASAAEEVISSNTAKINNVEQTIRDVVGSARLQDGYSLTDIVGKFEIWEDENGHVTVHLKDGAAMALDDTNGQTVMIGTRLNEIYNSNNDINQFISNFQGSTLWTQRNNITGIVGHFTEVDTVVADPDHPGQYKTVKKLVVESGGGFQIREDGVEYGLYMTPSSAYHEAAIASGANPYAKGLYERRSNGTYVLTTDTTVQSGKKYYQRGGNAVLTAGMLVDQINNETVTQIRGDRVNITAENVSVAANKSLDTIVGHFEEEEYLMEDGSHHPIIDPETGEQMVGKRLVYKADGGLMIKRLAENGVQVTCGLYDENNLTAGIIVDKVNGNPNVEIKGSRIIIGDISGNDLNTWASSAEGAIMARATINQLNAAVARISLLEADVVRTDDLVAKRTIAAGTLSARNFYIDTGIDSEMGSYDLKNAVAYAKITLDSSTNEYTLHLYRTTGAELTMPNGYSMTFSRATTLSGAWDGGNLKVSAAPQGNVYTIPFPHTQSTSSNSIFITPPGAATKTYIMSNTENDSDKVDLQTLYNGSYVTVARFNHGKNSAVTLTDPVWTYDGDNVSLNSRSSNTVTVKTSGRASQLTKAVSIYLTQGGWSNNKKTVYARKGSASGEFVALLEVDASEIWTNGNSAVTLTDPVWTYDGDNVSLNSRSSNTVTVKTSGRASQLTKAVSIYLTQGGWSNNKKTVYARKGSASGEFVALLEVDATSIWNDGVAYGASNATHTISYSGTNSTGTNTMFHVSCGSAGSTIYLERSGDRVYATTGNWFGHGTYVIRGSCPCPSEIQTQIEYVTKTDDSCSINISGTNSSGTNTHFTVYASSSYCGSDSRVIYLAKSGNRVYATTGGYFGYGSYVIRGSCPC